MSDKNSTGYSLLAISPPTFAAAAIGGGALMAGGMIAQGYFANKSSKRAARAQANAMDSYLAQMARSREAAIGYQRPYEEAGRSGLNLLRKIS